MATSKSVSKKMHVASKVCKSSAWVIAAIGVVAVIVYVSTLLPVIPYFRQSQYISIYSYTAMFSIISALFLIIVPTLFFSIILYALGTLLDYMIDETKPSEMESFFAEMEEEDDGRLEIVPIPEMR